MHTPAPGAILGVIHAADPPEVGQRGAQQKPSLAAAAWSLCWLVRAEPHTPSRSPALFHHTGNRWVSDPSTSAITGGGRGTRLRAGLEKTWLKVMLWASLGTGTSMPAWSFPCPRSCAQQHVPAGRLLSSLLQSPAIAASRCLQEHQPRTSSTCVPLSQGTAFALGKGRDFLLARVSTGPAPCAHIAIAKALAARCVHSQQAPKASAYLEAEMGTLGPRMFLNRRTPPATDACTKLTLQLGFSFRQGRHVLSLGLETRHVPQTLSRRARPRCGASRPLPQPASSQPADREKMPPRGGSIPSTSCLAPCELVNSRRHGCSPLSERAEMLLTHLAGIYVLTTAPGPCHCAQTPDPTRHLHLGCWWQGSAGSGPRWPPPSSPSPL